jgi:hypothetical protein
VGNEIAESEHAQESDNAGDKTEVTVCPRREQAKHHQHRGKLQDITEKIETCVPDDRLPTSTNDFRNFNLN